MTAIRDIALPSIRELGIELTFTSRLRLIVTLSAPFLAAAAYFVFAAHGVWVPAVLSVMLLSFLTYGSSSHELVHRNLGLQKDTNDAVLRIMEMTCLRSGTAYRLSHLLHHRSFPSADDVEAVGTGRGWLFAVLSGPTHQFRLWIWAWRTRAKHRRALALEAAWFVTVCAAGITEALQGRWILPVYVALVVVGSWTFPLLTVHFPHDPKGEFPLAQTRAFRGVFYDLIALGHLYHLEHHLYPMVPNHHWRKLATKLDPYFEQAGVVPQRVLGGASALSFWVRRAIGFVMCLPRIIHAACAGTMGNLRNYLSTRRRRFGFLSGKMEVFFLGGLVADLAPLIFGEAFWMIRYDGWLIDPGGPRVARSVVKHLDVLAPDAVRGVLGTHGHEEHVGNLELASSRLGVPVWLHPACEAIVRAAPRIPFMRRLVIGQPAPYLGPVRRVGDRLPSASTTFEVLAAPGHSDDHVVLYDPVEKLLLSGDAFVSTYFSAPNADVDSLKWIETLRHLATLDIEVLVTGHGKIYTLRNDFPDLAGVVVRQDPQACIGEKLRFLEWARSRVVSGLAQGLSVRAIEATLFPWCEPWSSRSFFVDTMAHALSGGDFSRAELVRTFLPRDGRSAIEPSIVRSNGTS